MPSIRSDRTRSRSALANEPRERENETQSGRDDRAEIERVPIHENRYPDELLN